MGHMLVVAPHFLISSRGLNRVFSLDLHKFQAPEPSNTSRSNSFALTDCKTKRSAW